MELQLVTDEEYLNSFPVGYRFLPTDEELVTHYLINKVLNRPLPINRIRDVNIYLYSPQQLSEMYKVPGEKNMYFFSSRDRKYPNGNRPDRAASDGYWKAMGKDTTILGQNNANPIGYKKSLGYYLGKPKPKGKAIKTDWIMQEYRIDQKHSYKRSKGIKSTGPNDMKLDDCVLCKIYMKETKLDSKQQDDIEVPDAIDSVENMPVPAIKTAEAIYATPLTIVKTENPGTMVPLKTDTISANAMPLTVQKTDSVTLKSHEKSSTRFLPPENDDDQNPNSDNFLYYPELHGPLYRL